MVDALLAGFLVLSLLSALPATNGWLAIPRPRRESRRRRDLLVGPDGGPGRAGAATARGPRRRHRARGGHGTGPGLRAGHDQPGEPEPRTRRHLRQPQLHGTSRGDRDALAAVRIGPGANPSQSRPRRAGGDAGRGRAGALALARRVGRYGGVGGVSRGGRTLGRRALGRPSGSTGTWCCWAAPERSGCCSRSSCPTRSTGARTRPISTPSPASPTTRREAAGGG